MSDKYYHTKESVEEYTQLAKGVNGSSLIEKLKIVLKPNSNLLELGSGSGTDWKILSETYNVTGSDNSNEFIQHLKSTFQHGNFEKLDAVSIETPEKFDGVFSNKVLHHLEDKELIASINRQSEILEEEGIICHSFWLGKGSEFFKGIFVKYHEEDELKHLFTKHFDIISIDKYAEFEDSDSILILARKKK